GFSDVPLRLAIWLGLSVSVFAVLYGAFVIGQWFVDRNLVTGWASTIVVISFLSGINLLMTGVMGLYVGRIHAEVKRRPLYVVETRAGFERAPAESDRTREAAERRQAG
ncbi:MAG TPA: glycosyltransferase, partial [Methylomirabilota bacterium]|nr:glycosyltransferase [Methylomirabilota bacterium]